MTSNPRSFTNEGDVKRVVKKRLLEHGWYYWMPAANGFGKAGVADFCAIRDGVFLAVETKFGTNKPSAMQKAYLNRVNAENCLGFVVSDRNLEWFEGWLAAFDRTIAAVRAQTEPLADDHNYMLNAIKAMTALLKE